MPKQPPGILRKPTIPRKRFTTIGMEGGRGKRHMVLNYVSAKSVQDALEIVKYCRLPSYELFAVLKGYVQPLYRSDVTPPTLEDIIS